ncbi:hypothetical protein E0F15_20660 [Frankia sp. B2]|uniref:type IV secretory system conjugative DNA transfer family protein n=1 Tax=Frankia sp. B2 TaxID=2541730 RepID=UPI001068F627|nr:hypothetical protein E0F15_20660 [Frankia sp. B2]
MDYLELSQGWTMAQEVDSNQQYRKGSTRSLSDAMITVALGELILFFVLYWLAGQISAVISTRKWPDLSVLQMGPVIVESVRSPANITSSWKSSYGVDVGPEWLFCLTMVILMSIQVFATVCVIRVGLNWRRRREFRLFRLGFASGREIRRTLGVKAVQKKGRSARPSYRGKKDVDPREVGFYLGRDVRSRQRLYGSIEDVFIILAPPRQGKDVHFCTPFTIDAPGPCIVTSTRADAFTNTYSSRAEVGEVFVFDPNGLTRWPERLRWSSVRGCEEPLIANTRGAALIIGAGFEMGGEDSFLVSVAISLMRIYLHTAAISGGTVRDIMRWSTQPLSPEPLMILRKSERDGTTPHGWASELEACMARDSRTRAQMWSTVVQALACFSDPAVLDSCSPGQDEKFNMKEFLSGRNTLYVLGKEDKNGSVAPIVTAMMEDLFDGARRLASQMPSSRLDPPLTVELNEAAHIAPLPNLPAYMGDSGGFSIALHVYFQSLSQARARWGDHEAMVMWDNAAIRVIMGGAGNIDDLDSISRLMGETRESKDGAGVYRRVLSPEEVRTLPFGTAVVVGRAARPVEVKLTPWWRRPDGKAIASGKAVVEGKIAKLVLRDGSSAAR